MSIEIEGFGRYTDHTIERLAAEAGTSGARAVHAAGASAAESFTIGSNAAEYGAKVLLYALVERELIDPSLISPEHVRMMMNLIEDSSGITDRRVRLQQLEDQRRAASIVR